MFTVVFGVDKWRLGLLLMGFPSRVGDSKRKRWGWFAEDLLSQSYSVWTPLQLMFCGLGPLSATRAFRVGCLVELIGVRK